MKGTNSGHCVLQIEKFYQPTLHNMEGTNSGHCVIEKFYQPTLPDQYQAQVFLELVQAE